MPEGKAAYSGAEGKRSVPPDEALFGSQRLNRRGAIEQTKASNCCEAEDCM
ncbi:MULTISPECIES: hypothetical protein [unclassified Mesorhizobium]|uniref:hypothetical protein n=1 Tax=unclassified Mesorhizobium TaxID=325217 RepID=UPI0003CFA642|nr:hypothetical protein [Mesorhizobium sp. L2C054A000]ESZ51736.1 hypothetical protein X731_04685 [Mesorhizobium sp. L2C054A000]